MKWLFLISVSFALPFTTAFADGHLAGAKAPTDDSTGIHELEEKKKMKFGEISVSELQEAMKKGSVTILDVNGLEKFNAGHVPGALHFESMDEAALAKALPEDKATLIVAYCGGPT
ncbi:rhodanese-like domain-containing protein [Rubritalea tangerina]|uniref:Rhodanese-like domain-containing protein n=2 Tax=Rubritalea tangerina TaxID=430798 RepID=A0ABW4Z6F6_9BACT